MFDHTFVIFRVSLTIVLLSAIYINIRQHFDNNYFRKLISKNSRKIAISFLKSNDANFVRECNFFLKLLTFQLSNTRVSETSACKYAYAILMLWLQPAQPLTIQQQLYQHTCVKEFWHTCIWRVSCLQKLYLAWYLMFFGLPMSSLSYIIDLRSLMLYHRLFIVKSLWIIYTVPGLLMH